MENSFRLIVLTLFLLFMLNSCLSELVASYEETPVIQKE